MEGPAMACSQGLRAETIGDHGPGLGEGFLQAKRRFQAGVSCSHRVLCASTNVTATINLCHPAPLHCASRTYLSYDDGFRSVNGLRRVDDCLSFESLGLEFDLKNAIETLKIHQNEGKLISNDILHHLIKRCMDENNLAAGKDVYSLIIGNGLESDPFLGRGVVRMLTHFEEFHEANGVFSKLVEPDVLAWTAILSANVKLGEYKWAVQLYRQMLKAMVVPDGHVFVEVLKACMDPDTEGHAHLIHASIIEYGLEWDAFVGSSLIDFYVKSGTLQDVILMFCRLPSHNTVTWTMLISGYVYHDSSEGIAEVFEQMQQDGAQPDQHTYVCILAAASDIKDVNQARQVHNHIFVVGSLINIYVGNALIDVYAQCGCTEDAQAVFDNLCDRNVVTWSSLILGYAEDGRSLEVFQLLNQMQWQGVSPNEVTYINVLKACSFAEQGHFLHEHLILQGFMLNVQVGTALIDMYVRCGSFSDAFLVFTNLGEKNVITWTRMITGCLEFSLFNDAFDLLRIMQDKGIKPNEITFLSLLKACSLHSNIEHGWRLHAYIFNSGLSSQLAVGNALIDMYASCQGLEDARAVFQRMPDRDVVSWTSLIAMHSHLENLSLDGIHIFHQMRQNGIKPNSITYSYVLNLMSKVTALEQGRQMHACIVESGLELNDIIMNSLLHLYATCGRLTDALSTFHRLREKSITNWSALLMACAQCRDYLLASEVFASMQLFGMRPDSVAFLCLLLACTSPVEGYRLMKSMRDEHGILLKPEHQNSMVDILGPAGYFDEAEDLLESNPFGSNAIGWTSLLHSCKLHINLAIAKRCFNNVVLLDPNASSAYVLMSAVYAHAGMVNLGEELEALRRKQVGRKKLAVSHIEINKEVQVFRVGDKLHPQSTDIYAKLDELNGQMKKEGYVPCVDVVLGPKTREKKEESLCGHSEKLAIAFGLISLPEGATIRVSKNLRMCMDCHNASKFISAIEKREIFVNDTYRVHQFSNGVCSCDDFCYPNVKR